MAHQSLRLTKILDFVLENGSIQVEDIETLLGVSPATARRDLDRLASQQMVTRVRGGAVANPLSGDLPLRYRPVNRGRAKQRLAKAAAKLVKPGDVIGLNGGTTTTEVSRELVVRVGADDGFKRQGITVVTNAINIANELALHPQIKVIVVGGTMRPCSYEIVGNMSGLVLQNLAMTRVFLGVVGIDMKRGLFNDDLLEAETNADFLKSAQRVTVVADSSKFSALGTARICDFTPIDEILTDCADSKTLELLEGQGIKVLTV